MSGRRDARHHLLHHAIVRHLEEGRADAVALRSARRTLRYGELAATVAAGARRIAERTPAESRVLVAARDQLEAGVAFLAVLAAERTPLLADPTSADGVRTLAARYAVAAAIVEPELRGAVERPTIELDHAPAAEPLVLAAVAPCDAAFWTFTSGTTGEPKAVVHSHAGPLAAHRAFALGVLGLGADDRTVATGGLPFVYVLGNGFLFPLFAGASAILPADLLLPTVLGELERQAATVLVSGPWSLAALVRSARRESWSAALARLRLVLSAGEALPAALFEEWRERFGRPPLDNLGCTEMFNSFVSNRPDDAAPGSLGRPVAGFEIRVGGAAPHPGARGALTVRGESRAIAIGGGDGGAPPRAVTSEWCDTGDWVEVDADDRVRFLGRSDDRLKIRGRFVHPVEVERTILELASVRECLIEVETDEQGLARLVLRAVPADPRAGGDWAAALLGHARRRLAAHEVPARIEVVEALPRSARGKLVRGRRRSA